MFDKVVHMALELAFVEAKRDELSTLAATAGGNVGFAVSFRQALQCADPQPIRCRAMPIHAVAPELANAFVDPALRARGQGVREHVASLVVFDLLPAPPSPRLASTNGAGCA